MNNKKTVGIFTLGCRVNQYESCAISEILKQRGLEVSKSDDCDYYIINTCAVTAESERKSRQLVRRCAKKGMTVVIGCASQLNADDYDIENVIYVGGNRNKMNAVEAICDNVTDKMSVVSMNGAEYENMYITEKDTLFSECRAFIKIQDGCNGKCTYCIIPKCRGSVRSREASEIVKEAQTLVNCGYSEIILTGIEVSAYNKMPLAELIKAVSGTEGLKRLRLGSLSPNVITDKFLETVSKLDVFMPHIHLSLQSCSDKILTAMKRPYRKKDIFERIKAIRKYIPKCNISADIIVGFPGETEDDFYETLSALDELRIFHVHSFPYSEREGTVAASMPDSVPKNIRSDRNARLISQNAKTRKAILDKKIGLETEILIEKIDGGFCFGHTEDFFEARLDKKDHKVGEFVKVIAMGHDGLLLYTAESENAE